MLKRFCISLMAFCAISASSLALAVDNTYVKLVTSEGNIEIELNAQKAPISVDNFLQYVKDGSYNGTIFHRVIPGFMIQGGGFDKEMNQKKTRAAIHNEADNSLKNIRGSVAMARTSDPNSATSQFFINVVDNAFLNKSSRDYGYAVFGKVIKGMDVVDKITKVNTDNVGSFQNVPVKPISIISAQVVKK